MQIFFISPFHSRHPVLKWLHPATKLSDFLSEREQSRLFASDHLTTVFLSHQHSCRNPAITIPHRVIIVVEIYCFRYLSHVIDSNPHIYFLSHALQLLGNFPAYYFLQHNSLQIMQIACFCLL